MRNGLGAMPAFGPERISDEELGRLVACLLELRRPAQPEESSSGFRGLLAI